VTTPTLAGAFLARFVAGYRAVEPGTRMRVETGRASEAVAAVADGNADLGLVASPIDHPGVRAEIFHRSEARCLMWAHHRLAARERVRPADLAGEPLLAPTRRFAARAQVDRAFADAGIEPLIVAEAASIELIVRLVQARLGVAVLNPFPIDSIVDAALAWRPFEPAIAFEAAFLLPASGASLPVARRFADFIRAGLRGAEAEADQTTL
jgi:DNA-binding transcriptional LysR family regulator